MICILISCSTGSRDNFRSGTFQIKATVLTPQDSLTLGDTLKLVFEIPDTISLNGSQTILITKRTCNLNESIYITDSPVPGGINFPLAHGWCTLSANPGYFINNGVNFSKTGNRLYTNYYIIPQRRGVFFIFSDGIGGYFHGSSSLNTIQATVTFDFNVSNMHYDILRKAIGCNNNIDPFIQSHISRGQGVYAFAVK